MEVIGPQEVCEGRKLNTEDQKTTVVKASLREKTQRRRWDWEPTKNAM